MITSFLNSDIVNELVTLFQILCNSSANTFLSKNQKISNLVDSTLSDVSNLIILQDHIGRITYVNSVITSFWGIQRETALGKTLHELTHELDFSAKVRTILDRKTKAAALTKQATHCEIEVLTDAEPRHYVCTFHPIFEYQIYDINSLLCVMTEITTLKTLISADEIHK